MLPKPIDKLVQQKLEGHVSVPSPDLWAKLEKALPTVLKPWYQKPSGKLMIALILLSVGGATGWWIGNQKSSQANKAHKTFQEDKQAIHQKHFDIPASKDSLLAPENIEKEQKNVSKTLTEASTSKKSNQGVSPEATQAKVNHQLTDDSLMIAKNNELAKNRVSSSTDKKLLENTPKEEELEIKVIIKLSQPKPVPVEPAPREGKAQEFSDTKIGKFLRKAKRIKNGEEPLPINIASLRWPANN